MEEFKKNYKQLIDESLVTKNKEQFLKKCDEFTEEVIKKDILPEDVVDLHKTYIASLNLKTSQILCIRRSSKRLWI